jgi:gamma-glutamyltranspeptidase/glutathione hydrolase
MAPTLVKKDGRVLLVLGSPGGSRIITAVLETILNIVDYGMAPQEAVKAHRLHHQWLTRRGCLRTREPMPEAVAKLSGIGCKLIEQWPWGAVELIEVANDRF